MFSVLALTGVHTVLVLLGDKQAMVSGDELCLATANLPFVFFVPFSNFNFFLFFPSPFFGRPGLRFRSTGAGVDVIPPPPHRHHGALAGGCRETGLLLRMATRTHRRCHCAQCCAGSGSTLAGRCRFPSAGESALYGGGGGGTPLTGERSPDGGGDSVLRQTALLRRLAILAGGGDTPSTGESAADRGGDSTSCSTGESALDGGGE
jgi:hypothetical protein